MIIHLYAILSYNPLFLAFLYTISFFTFSWLFFFFSFYPELRKLYFDVRTNIGKWKTQHYRLKEKFKDNGGVVGYESSNEDHIALIYPSESSMNYPSLEKEGILTLMDHYQNENIKFKLYFCSLCDNFINIIKSDNVTGIHIFGHGKIDSLAFEDGVLEYRELKDVEPKEFVAQWHCNHGYGKSLGEYIGKKYYSPYGKRRIFQNKRDFKKLLNNGLIWELNEKFS